MKTWIITLMLALTTTAFAQLPALDPALDDTGALTQLYDNKAACNIERQAILEDIQLDWHPLHGVVTPEMHRVSDAGFQMAQLDGLLPAGTENVEIKPVSVSGLGLVQHRIGDEDFYVWHRLDGERLLQISFPNPNPDIALREVIYINSMCGNWVAVTICDELDAYCNWLHGNPL